MDKVIENIISGFTALDQGKLAAGDKAEWQQFRIRQSNARYFLENANKHPYTIGTKTYKNEWSIPPGTRLGKRPINKCEHGFQHKQCGSCHDQTPQNPYACEKCCDTGHFKSLALAGGWQKCDCSTKTQVPE